MDQELQTLLAQLIQAQTEGAAQLEETKRILAELAERGDRRQAETDRQLAETDRQIRRVNKQVGDLGNKFGTFTEGLAWPSLDKLLRQKFGMTDVGPRRKFVLNGQTLEVDGFGWDITRARKEAYVVEVKSRLDNDGVAQLLNALTKLPRFSPVLRDCKLYGIIAAVDIPENMRGEVLKHGFYLALLSDETFRLLNPPRFKPKDYGLTASRNGTTNGHPKKKDPRQ